MTHLRIIPGVLSARWRFSFSQSSSATLIQGWLRTPSADRRFDASLTNKLLIKSLASSLTSRHSFSGKLKRPKSADKNDKNKKRLKIGLITRYRSTNLHELTQITALGIFGNSRPDSSHTLLRSCRKMADSQRVRYKQWHPSTTNHIVYRSCFHARPRIDQLPPGP